MMNQINKKLLSILRQPFTVDRYDTFIDYLTNTYSNMPWITYPQSIIEDVKDIMCGVIDPDAEHDKEEFINDMRSFLSVRIDKYRKNSVESQKALNQYLAHKSHEPKLTKDERRRRNYSKEIVFDTLTWLDLIVEYRRYTTGYLKLQFEVDTWLLEWLTSQV